MRRADLLALRLETGPEGPALVHHIRMRSPAEDMGGGQLKIWAGDSVGDSPPVRFAG